MKLAPRTWRLLWDLHAWVGATAAVVLCVMFFTGAFVPFVDDIAAWELPRDAAPASSEVRALFERVVAEQGPFGEVTFALDASGPTAEYDDARGAHWVRLDPRTGALERVAPSASSVLYDLHFLNVFPGGYFVAGLLAVAMLLALVTGTVIHLRDLGAQLVRFRPERSPRVWSADLHKVLGVFGLPFQGLIAWSGAVLCLGAVTVQPAFVAAVFAGDRQAESAEHGRAPPPPGASHEAAAGDPAAAIAAATRAMPELRPRWAVVHAAGDVASTVDVYGDLDGAPFAAAEVRVRTRDAVVVDVRDPRRGPPAARFERWLFGLHFIRRAPVGLKALYALLAWATCAVLVTGNIVWLERRDRRRLHPGNRLFERLTWVAPSSLVLAVATLFAIARLVPARAAGVEEPSFWVVWGASFVVGVASRRPGATAAGQLRMASVLMSILGTVDAAASVANPTMPGRLRVDVGLVVLGLLVGAVGAVVARPRLVRTAA